MVHKVDSVCVCDCVPAQKAELASVVGGVNEERNMTPVGVDGSYYVRGARDGTRSAGAVCKQQYWRGRSLTSRLSLTLTCRLPVPVRCLPQCPASAKRQAAMPQAPVEHYCS